MPVISRRLVPPQYPQVTGINCPSCQCKLMRERRRPVDRLQSVFLPVKRYRCANFDCQWVGNIADADDGAPGPGTEAGKWAQGDDYQRYRYVPTSFVVAMILVAAALVFVMAIPYTMG